MSPFRSLVYAPVAGAALLAASGAEAADPLPVAFKATTSGAPASTASLMFEGENERHPVNVETGDWIGDVLYLPDGTETPFLAGTVLDACFAAPMHKTTCFSLQVAKPKAKRKVTFDLVPLTVPSLACFPAGLDLTPANGKAILTAVQASQPQAAGPDEVECLHHAAAWAGYLHWAHTVQTTESREETWAMLEGALKSAEVLYTTWQDWVSAAARSDRDEMLCLAVFPSASRCSTGG